MRKKRKYLRARNKKLNERLIELGYLTYNKYLESDHWKTLRKRYYKGGDVKNMIMKYGQLCCTFCTCINKQLNIHHRTYRNLGNEKLGELILLCRDCHYEVHKEESKEKRHLWSATTIAGRKIRKRLKEAGE